MMEADKQLKESLEEQISKLEKRVANLETRKKRDLVCPNIDCKTYFNFGTHCWYCGSPLLPLMGYDCPDCGTPIPSMQIGEATIPKVSIDRETRRLLARKQPELLAEVEKAISGVRRPIYCSECGRDVSEVIERFRVDHSMPEVVHISTTDEALNFRFRRKFRGY